jgi:hypothetical protein
VARCRHGVVFARMWLSGEWVVLMGDEDGADARRCSSCREWLSLGESNDDDPRVAVEVRAAELAARRGFGSFANCGAGCERCGFVTHKNDMKDMPVLCDARQFNAGYLVGCITETEDSHD